MERTSHKIALILMMAFTPLSGFADFLTNQLTDVKNWRPILEIRFPNHKEIIERDISLYSVFQREMIENPDNLFKKPSEQEAEKLREIYTFLTNSNCEDLVGIFMIHPSQIVDFYGYRLHMACQHDGKIEGPIVIDTGDNTNGSLLAIDLSKENPTVVGHCSNQECRNKEEYEHRSTHSRQRIGTTVNLTEYVPYF